MQTKNKLILGLAAALAIAGTFLTFKAYAFECQNYNGCGTMYVYNSNFISKADALTFLGDYADDTMVAVAQSAAYYGTSVEFETMRADEAVTAITAMNSNATVDILLATQVAPQTGDDVQPYSTIPIPCVDNPSGHQNKCIYDDPFKPKLPPPNAPPMDPPACTPRSCGPKPGSIGGNSFLPGTRAVLLLEASE